MTENALVTRLTPTLEAQIRAWCATVGRPKRRMRWALPLLMAEIDALRADLAMACAIDDRVIGIRRERRRDAR